MGSLIDIGAVILSRAERRLEIAGGNVANALTPGYKGRSVFSDLLVSTETQPKDSAWVSIDLSQGKLQETGSPFDVAIAGSGMFVLKSGSGDVFTRNGRFRLDENRRLVSGDGLPVQSYQGDIFIEGQASILEDGTILEDGVPIAQLRIVDAEPGAWQTVGDNLFLAPNASIRELETPVVKQGMIEASNISYGREMVTTMQTLKLAETGQRVVQVYDDLMSRVITTFGQA